MKVRDTSRGRMYAVSSGIGCTAINGAMAVDIPAGGQSVVLALDKKLIIAGDDNAKFVEVRWGTNAAVGSRPSPSWMGDILDGLVSIVGVDKFDVNYIPAENKLYLIFSLDTTSAQIEEVKSLCARVLPSNVVTEMEWADGLPMTYTRLDFLEATGSQYIDTGIKLSNESEVRCKFEPLDFAQNQYVYGACTSHLVDDFSCLLSAGGNTFQTRYGLQNNTFAFPNTSIIDIQHSNEVFVNGVYKYKFNETPFESANACRVFDRSNLPFIGRIYSFSISRSSRSQLNFIPALDHTGRPCMFDTVARETFYNAAPAGADFVAGMTLEQVRDLRLPTTGGQLTLSLPYEASIDGIAQAALEQARANGWVLTLQYDEAELPAGYSKLDFLEGTGTQYVDTGLKLSNESEVKCEFMTVEITGAMQRLYGCFALPRFSCYSGYPEYMTVTCYIADDSLGIGMNKVQLGKKITLCHNVEKFTVDGVVYAFKTTPSAFETYKTCQLFNTDDDKNTLAHARIYSFDISRNNSLQLAYIPCLDSEGVPCMFDLVSRQHFRNNGTGQFIVGMTLEQVRGLSLPAGGGQLTLALPYEASIDKLAQTALEQARENGWELTLQYAEAEVPAGYRRLEYLESTGTQYIDTGVKLSNESEVACEYETDYIDATGFTSTFGNYNNFPQFSNYVTYPASYSNQYVSVYVGSATPRCYWPREYGKCLLVINGKYASYNGNIKTYEGDIPDFETNGNCRVFSGMGLNFVGRIYAFAVSRSGETQLDYVPCISPEGKLGMYNKVDGTLKENIGGGAFIAGLATIDDVRNLWLPETNGELTVSVPADTPDSAVDQLRTNNPTWQIAIQFRTDNEN